MTAAPTVTVSAVVLRDDAGRVLTVRKHGSERFQLPGGKPEPGEDAATAAVRETAEEVGAVLCPEHLTLLGVWRAPAANEAGHEVHGTVYLHPPAPITGASAEIAELRWQPVETIPADLAPLLALHVFPALRDDHRTPVRSED
ncbi:NUDIX domain-containing protein [Flexivirga sp. ID2601S]|uniref:NUDIX domain-containing protein n=1 Tax=Flexivirga aerilata TaxID=1656889 RepID=A0A849AGX9_9MICO|nr:NUDIX domain-containing protein [Flexivirga aerilata]NNG39117.1 NUDIX domain-containing protein [Flexivirga aerilata]